MAVQFSLSYDADGNGSLVRNEIASSPKTIDTSQFVIGEYESKKSIYTGGIIESEEDPFDYENQLKILKTYVTENDYDIGNESTPTRPLSTPYKSQSMILDQLEKAYGKNSTQYINYQKAVSRGEMFEDIKLGSNITSLASVPYSGLGRAISNIGTRYTDKVKADAISELHRSDWYQADMQRRQEEFNQTGDYDVWSTGTGTGMGPQYSRREDLKPGTVFDAEDHGEPPSTPRQDQGVQVGDNYQDNSDRDSGTGTMDASDFSDDTPGTPF